MGVGYGEGRNRGREGFLWEFLSVRSAGGKQFVGLLLHILFIHALLNWLPSI